MASLSDILPSSVMVEILAWLPARSIGRFRCVSKSWNALLSERYFVRMWSNRGGTSLLVVPLTWGNCDQCSLVFENVSIGEENIRLPLGNRWLPLCVVGSSSDGNLICLTGVSYGRHGESNLGVILWSPFKGEVKVLKLEGYIYYYDPALIIETHIQGYHTVCDDHYHVYGFGYEPNSRDYKIVRITYSGGVARRDACPIRPWHVEVYSLARDKWKSLGRPDFKWRVHGHSRAFVNGSAHWLAYPTKDDPYDSIVAFRMEEESFGEVIKLPQSEDLSQFSLDPMREAMLSVLRGSLALIAFNEWNHDKCGIWVMKEYGVAESWTKQHHIVLPNGLYVRKALGLTRHGKILLRMIDEKLVCCDPEDVQITELGIQGGHGRSTFDVIDLGGGDPNLRNQVGRGSPLTILNDL